MSFEPMPPLRLSVRATVAAALVALAAGVVGVVVGSDGGNDGRELASTAPTTEPTRNVIDGDRSLTATTASRSSTTTAAAAVSATATPPTSTDSSATATSRPSPRSTTTDVPRPPATAGDPSPSSSPSSSSSATSPPNAAPPSNTATTGPAPAVAPPATDAEIAARIVAEHNQIRAARGLAPLQRSSCLDGVAIEWAVHLTLIGILGHNPLSPMLSDACLAWHEVGENVGYDSTVEAIASAWMQSGEHAANILDPDFSQIGVGVVRHNGLLWVVVNFAG